MSIINISDQFYYTNKGYLDAKMQPVATKADLQKITRSHRFIGLTVLVLDDGEGLGPREYWIKDKVTTWVLKETSPQIKIEGGDVEK